MRVALRAPIAGKLGEEFDRVFDRLLAPRLYNEPLLPPFPFETAGTEWMPIMDVIENARSTSCARGARDPQGEPGHQPRR